MQIPIVNGVYTDVQANYRTAYPRNMVPVPKQTGIAEGYLRIMDGITQRAAPDQPGFSRGGINWNGKEYRAVGGQVLAYEEDGSHSVVAGIEDDGGQVIFTYSFDYLAFASAGKLRYYNPAGVSVVTAASLNSAGTGYQAGDTIQVQNGVVLVVSTVGGGGSITGLSVQSGGIILTSQITPGAVVQLSTSGVGTGASFFLTWSEAPGNVVLVTDPDLGNVVDLMWMDGFFITTDGEFIVVTELDAPTSVNPLKYGSSEADPDPITGLIKYRNELYAFNRYTTEIFDNVGSSGFPFQANEGAVVEKGAISHTMKCRYAQQLAFVGSGVNEPTSVYVLIPGAAQKIATQEIEEILRGYTEEVLATCILEAREDRIHQHLMLHLPDQTLVYDIAATAVLQQPVWFVLSSDVSTYGPWRARNFIWVYNKWTCGDRYDSRIGYLDRTVATQYGDQVGWQFDVSLLYNEAKGAIVPRLELIGLTGRAPFGTKPTISYAWTWDGLTWSNPRFIDLGRQGAFNQRLLWLNALYFREYASMRFRGVTPSLCSFTRLEAQVEPLSV